MMQHTLDETFIFEKKTVYVYASNVMHESLKIV